MYFYPLSVIIHENANFSLALPLPTMGQEKAIYNRVKICLAIKHVPNKDLAKHLDVSVQTVSKWCTNTGQPSIPQLFAISRFLNMNVCELLEQDK